MRCRAITSEYQQCRRRATVGYFCFSHKKYESLYNPLKKGMFYGKEQRQVDVIQCCATILIVTGQAMRCQNLVVDPDHCYCREHIAREDEVNAQIAFLFKNTGKPGGH